MEPILRSTTNPRTRFLLVLLLVVTMLGFSALVNVKPAQAYVLCSVTTWRSVKSGSSGVTGITLNVYLQGAYDSRTITTYCGGIRGYATLTKSGGFGGPLNVTLNPDGHSPISGSSTVPNGAVTNYPASTAPAWSSSCGTVSASYSNLFASTGGDFCAS
ncbi:MAG: hypothetical protein H0X31_17210 [Nostocaceae cyanobacterium]|nr:hypothetical protein [Nostocaceae cyanobacterium]